MENRKRTDFFISDLHIGHENIIKFTHDDGSLIRPFSSMEDMETVIEENWNSVVTPKDRVFCIGDMIMKASKLKFLSRLNGEKVLIMGNHDVFRQDDYAKYFTGVLGVMRYRRQFVLSHVPAHPGSMDRWKYNIHGHLHQHNVRKEDGTIDPKYINVSAEQLNYTPISIDQLCEKYNIDQ